MDTKEKIIRQRFIDELQQEYLDSLEERANRYLEVKPHPIIPDHRFASVSTECSLLFRDGHYYGCIALVQTVAEGVVKFICKRNRCNAGEDFKKNVHKLCERGFLVADIRDVLLSIWKNRNDYHHLNKGIKKDREELEHLAKAKVLLLKVVEQDIFGFEIKKPGILTYKHPKYWDTTNKGTKVFLRCEP